MKIKHLTFFLLILLMLIPNFATAQEIKNDETEFLSKAFETSKQLNKPVFLFFHAQWCPNCKVMKSDVFVDPAVKELLDSRYIFVEVDIDTPESRFLRTVYPISSFPTMFVLGHDGEVLYNLQGKFSAPDLITELRYAYVSTKQLPFLKDRFEQEVSNPNKCLDYILTLRKGQPRTAISPAAHQYLATQTDEQLLSKINWRIIANAVTDIKSREFQYVLKNKSQFENLISKERVQRKIDNIANELLRPLVESRSLENYQSQRLIVKEINLRSTDSIVFVHDLDMYQQSNMLTEYDEAALLNVEKFFWNDASKLAQVLNNYSQLIITPNSIIDVVKWGERLIVLNDIYDNQMLVSNLFLKYKQKDKALIFAQKAKENRANYGFDMTEVDALLLEIKK